MPRIVYLDETGLVEIVGIYDATVIFMVFTMQKCIKVLHEVSHLTGASGGGRRCLSDCIQIPPRMAIHFAPENAELLP